MSKRVCLPTGHSEAQFARCLNPVLAISVLWFFVWASVIWALFDAGKSFSVGPYLQLFVRVSDQEFMVRACGSACWETNTLGTR